MSRVSRRAALASIAGAFTLLARRAHAEGSVPLSLQAQLMGRLGSFDRNFALRAGTLARILVVHKAGDDESSRVATNVGRDLSELHDVGGLAAHVQVEPYADGPTLASRCRTQKVAMIYFSTALEGDIAAASAALAGVDILTVGATASLADSGAVAAFDLEEGRPKIVVHLARAKAQNVAFKAELLKLARIVG
jgi:hypothetical protein